MEGREVLRNCAWQDSLHIHWLSAIYELFSNSSKTVNRLWNQTVQNDVLYTVHNFSMIYKFFSTLFVATDSLRATRRNNRSLDQGALPFLIKVLTLQLHFCLYCAQSGSQHLNTERKQHDVFWLFSVKKTCKKHFFISVSSELLKKKKKLCQLLFPIVSWGGSCCHPCWHSWLWCLVPSLTHLTLLNFGTDTLTANG